VEPVSGLPRSLIDLFATIEDADASTHFWLWPGEQGDFLQCHLWEAYRMAGILFASRFCKHPPSVGDQHLRLPPSEILVNRLLAAIDAVLAGSSRSQEERSPIKNALLYPLFVVSTQISVLNRNPPWKRKIRHWFVELAERDIYYNVTICWDFLKELWHQGREDVDIHAMAQERHIEVTLL
jgi:hypothetical protein